MDGQSIFSITLFHGYIPQILLAELVFFLYEERRERFWLRICTGLPLFLLLSIVLPNLIARFTSGFFP